MTALPHNPATEALEARQDGTVTTAHLSVQLLCSQGRKVADAMGLHVSQNRLQRLVRRYLRDGHTDVDFSTWFLGYADPTGDTAVWNVEHGGACR